MKTYIKGSLLGLAMLLAVPAQAANVLYGFDFFLGTDVITPALAAGGHTVTTHNNNWAGFDTDLALGGWDVVIAVVQNSAVYPDQTTLANYIAGGGKVIYADWTGDAAYGALFEATYTGSVNDASATFSPLFNVTNPVTITNPGWGTYSLGLAPTGGGVSLCTGSPSGDSCMVQGNGGNTLLLGFLADVFTDAEGQQIFEDAVALLVTPQESVPVPTMSQWALIVLALLLMTAVFMRRRKV